MGARRWASPPSCCPATRSVGSGAARRLLAGPLPRRPGPAVALNPRAPRRPPRRPYTPTSEVNQRGHVDFVIKLYPDGEMSQALAQVGS